MKSSVIVVVNSILINIVVYQKFVDMKVWKMEVFFKRVYFFCFGVCSKVKQSGFCCIVQVCYGNGFGGFYDNVYVMFV